MKLKKIERLLAVLLLVVWFLLLIRDANLNPMAFNQMGSLIILGSLAVVAVVVLSFATRRPMFTDEKEKDADVKGQSGK